MGALSLVMTHINHRRRCCWEFPSPADRVSGRLPWFRLLASRGSGLGLDGMATVRLTLRDRSRKMSDKSRIGDVPVRSDRVGVTAKAASLWAIFFADFAAYTYLNPLLQQRAGLTGEQVTLVLLGFGIAGGVTNFTAGRTVRHHLRATMFTAGALVGIGALLITLANGEAIVTIVFVLVWGAGFGAVPVAAQTWMAQTMPQTVEGGLALFVSALQGSLAAGSAVG